MEDSDEEPCKGVELTLVPSTADHDDRNQYRIETRKAVFPLFQRLRHCPDVLRNQESKFKEYKSRWTICARQPQPDYPRRLPRQRKRRARSGCSPLLFVLRPVSSLPASTDHGTTSSQRGVARVTHNTCTSPLPTRARTPRQIYEVPEKGAQQCMTLMRLVRAPPHLLSSSYVSPDSQKISPQVRHRKIWESSTK